MEDGEVEAGGVGVAAWCEEAEVPLYRFYDVSVGRIGWWSGEGGRTFLKRRISREDV